MKTLFYNWNHNWAPQEQEIVAETEHSYICKIGKISKDEFCVSKKEEGVKWFRTMGDYEAFLKKEKDSKIAALKAELEELEELV